MLLLCWYILYVLDNNRLKPTKPVDFHGDVMLAEKNIFLLFFLTLPNLKLFKTFYLSDCLSLAFSASCNLTKTMTQLDA